MTKVIVLSSIVTIAAGIGVYAVGGLNILLLSILIPAFVMPIFFAISIGISLYLTGSLVQVGKEFVDNFTKSSEKGVVNV